MTRYAVENGAIRTPATPPARLLSQVPIGLLPIRATARLATAPIAPEITADRMPKIKPPANRTKNVCHQAPRVRLQLRLRAATGPRPSAPRATHATDQRIKT